MLQEAPAIRLRGANEKEYRSDGDFVLYWMIANRRTRWNFALQHALARAEQLGKPLLVLEALRCDYPWASDRLHRFVVDGMDDNAQRFEQAGVRYHPWVEEERGGGRGLLAALARSAALVVTDEFPCFFLPRMVAAAAAAIDVRMEVVDSNGILPLRAADRAFARAYDFRRFLQKSLAPHLEVRPEAEPLRAHRSPGTAVIPREILTRWPAARPKVLAGEDPGFLGTLPIDHDVPPVMIAGGSRAGEARVRTFLDERLGRYGTERNQPQQDVASGLSPYLHFGHVSAHMVFEELVEREDWTPQSLGSKASGQREGWWGMSADAEAFLDELITWREVGYGFCHHRPDDYDTFESLPNWSRATLEKHASDPRDYVYELAQLEAAETHDDLWNAAQLQLRREGIIHNYLRMLWGKKILEWTRTPQRALEILIELNNKYAIDGRNPNSYSGIFWTLGRFDRAWGPEREVYGTVRYMSSKNTAKKVKVREYVARQLEPGLFDGD